jgi:hypothetical protein
MKKNILLMTIAALAGISVMQAVPTTPVLTPGTYQAANNEIFLGFSSASLSKDYVVDLGDYSTMFLSSFTGGQTLNINTDLTTVFGASYATLSDLKWSVYGLNYNLDTGAVVSAVGSVIAGAPALATKSVTALNNADTALTSVISQLVTDTSLVYGMQQLNGDNGDAKGVNMWLGVADSASPFSTYNQTIAAATGTNLDIYNSTASTASKIYTLNFNSGIVSSVAAVPEPSTYALFGFGALLLVIAYRRKMTA